MYILFFEGIITHWLKSSLHWSTAMTCKYLPYIIPAREDKPANKFIKCVHGVLLSCVELPCKLLERVRNKLLTTCNKLNGSIRLVTRLFQQD